MAASLLAASLLRYASYRPGAPPNNSDWDVLYVAVGMAVILFLVVAAASLANAREDRRH